MWDPEMIQVNWQKISRLRVRKKQKKLGTDVFF